MALSSLFVVLCCIEKIMIRADCRKPLLSLNFEITVEVTVDQDTWGNDGEGENALRKSALFTVINYIFECCWVMILNCEKNTLLCFPLKTLEISVFQQFDFNKPISNIASAKLLSLQWNFQWFNICGRSGLVYFWKLRRTGQLWNCDVVLHVYTQSDSLYFRRISLNGTVFTYNSNCLSQTSSVLVKLF